MSFVRTRTMYVFAILLSIYIFFVNYYVLDHIYGKFLTRATIQLHGRFFHNLIPTAISGPMTPKQTLVTFNNIAASSATQKDFDNNIVQRQVMSDIQTPTAAKTAVQNDIINYVPFYQSYDSMIKDDAEHHPRYFPEESLCPYLGLRKPYVTTRQEHASNRSPNTTCIPRQQSVEGCQEAIKYYGKPGTFKERSCSQAKAVLICSILGDSIREKERLEISCDFSKCSGKPVMVALFDDATGKIKNKRLVSSPKRLTKVLRHHAASSKFGSGFALLRCARRNKLQVLTLPKILGGKTKSLRRNEKRLNINIIVEDSLSRPHFYRTLTKTASAFRKIIHDRSIPATVLDFEMVQSYASMTSYNMKRFFTGRKYVGSDSGKVYAMEEFFAEFKKRGYTTLFQEDQCWYNPWGSILDPRQKVGVVKNENTRIRRWRDFVEILRNTKRLETIDDFAMHFLICHVLSHLKVTNVYNGRKLPKVCFHGRHHSSLFLDYVDKFVSINDDSDQPFMLYTHVDTSHERTGRRIVNDDKTLADLFMKAAHLNNTLTIFISDHGGKTTPFSTYTTQGREEVFKPLLFMIIPHQVSEVLGVQIMNSLVLNQKLLVGLEDLHDALVSLINGEKPGGLFQTLPFNRTCEELDLNSDVLCLCQGMDKSVANDSFDVLWAAEYALGTINNRIQQQYIASLKAKHEGHVTSGYTGACQRYRGLSIARARHIIKGENQTFQFSLFVEPFHKKTVEVFDVQVTFPVQKKMGITLSHLVRVSLFSEYEQCADDGVDPKLCSCHLNLNDTLRWQNELISKAKSKKSFSLQPESYFLHYPCLSIVRRIHKWLIQSRFLQDTVITYEALNSCADVTYNLTVGTKKVVKSRLSMARPFNVTLFPRTMTFLMTVNNDWKFGKVIPHFEFRKIS